MEARSKKIEDWFSMIRDGQVSLPRFQRFEAWRPNQIEGVFENILRTPSLPIGALLVLEVGDEELFVSRPIVGAPETQKRPQLNLLDGQQRMTALWRALHDDYPDLTVVVALENEDERRSDVEIYRRYTHNASGNRMPRWLDDPKATLERGWVPMSILRPGVGGERASDDWMEDAEVSPKQMKQIIALRAQIASYSIPFLSLPVTTEKETALDVFINMNTSASPLKDFDIVVAQLEGAVGRSLHDMIEELHQEVPIAKRYGRMEDIVLAVGALLNNKPPLKRSFLETGFGEELAKKWPRVIKGIKRGLQFLQDERIYNEKLLPTEVILYLTSALWANVPDHGTDQEGRARKILRKTVWRASYTDRYLKTATTRAFADYKDILRLIEDPTAQVVPELFNDEANPVPGSDELERGGWPSRKDRLGRAILATSLYSGGYDFADGAKASADAVDHRELHHIYPKALLADTHSETRINCALNCALISWKANRIISAKSPADYIAERAQDAAIDEAEVKQRLKSHLVPYKKLVQGDFDAFIRKRADLIAKRAMDLCDGNVPG